MIIIIKFTPNSVGEIPLIGVTRKTEVKTIMWLSHSGVRREISFVDTTGLNWLSIVLNGVLSLFKGGYFSVCRNGTSTLNKVKISLLMQVLTRLLM
jgi:hypothetical protein